MGAAGEGLDGLVAYGWNDGIRRKLDDERTMEHIARRKTEEWGRRYKERAQGLIAGGRMRRGGLFALERRGGMPSHRRGPVRLRDPRGRHCPGRLRKRALRV